LGGGQLTVLRGSAAGVLSVAFSPDGRQIVSSSDGGDQRPESDRLGYIYTSQEPVYDNSLRLWDADNGREVIAWNLRDCIWSAIFSPDGRFIVSGLGKGAMRLWDAQTGRALRTFVGHERQVTSLAFFPDGHHFVSGSLDKTLRVWNVEMETPIALITGHSDDVNGVAVASDGGIASASKDETVRLWTAAGIHRATLRAQKVDSTNQEFLGVAVAPGGRRVAAACSDGTLRVWDAVTGQEENTFRGHSQAVSAVAFSRDGHRILSGSYDSTVRIWDSESGLETLRLNGHESFVSSVAFSPDGRRAASGALDATVRLWDTEVVVKRLSLIHGHEGAINFIEVSPDGRRVITGSDDSTLRLWDGETGREMAVMSGHQKRVICGDISADGRLLISGSDDTTVRLWEVETGRELAVLRGQGERVDSVAFSPDGQHAVSGSYMSICVWDLARKLKIGNTAENEYVEGIVLAAYSVDGKRILASDHRGKYWAWDAETREALPAIDTGRAATDPSRLDYWEKDAVSPSRRSGFRIKAHQKPGVYAASNGGETEFILGKDLPRGYAPDVGAHLRPDLSGRLWTGEFSRTSLIFMRLEGGNREEMPS
jgi:WD40 repeat protein